jgi:hypothetical protein
MRAIFRQRWMLRARPSAAYPVVRGHGRSGSRRSPRPEGARRVGGNAPRGRRASASTVLDRSLAATSRAAHEQVAAGNEPDQAAVDAGAAKLWGLDLEEVAAMRAFLDKLLKRDLRAVNPLAGLPAPLECLVAHANVLPARGQAQEYLQRFVPAAF